MKRFGFTALVLLILLITALTLSWNHVFPNHRFGACDINQENLGSFIDIPGGGFVFGANALAQGEGPPSMVFVSSFRLQAHEVTNGQFDEFVKATGYVTDAERNGGSAQFRRTETPEDVQSWWTLDKEATWRTPEGAGSTIDGRMLHPVVHVTLNDARAYAIWAGGRIPTEVEWEYAAHLGVQDSADPFSGVRNSNGALRANIWTGIFPVLNTHRDGYDKTAPVGCFEPGRTGAYDMIGNVWEWTETRTGKSNTNFNIKGGSYLCSEDYCQNYRVAARAYLDRGFSTPHVGFRIVKNMEQNTR